MLKGHLDNVNIYEVVGWTWNETTPQTRLELDIFINNVAVGTCIADRFRPDLLESNIGDGKYSFHFRFPKALSAAERHVVRVCLKHGGANIGQSPIVIEPSQGSHSVPAQFLDSAPLPASDESLAQALLQPNIVEIKGHLDNVSLRHIAGWAKDSSDVPVSLLVSDNDVLLARVLANRYRKDLQEAGIGNGRHAFEVEFQKRLSPFESHEIHVRREIDGIDLPGSPIVIEQARTIDKAAKGFLTHLLAGAQTTEDITGSIDFLVGEVSNLLTRLTELHGKGFERHDYRQFMNRWRRRLPDAEAAVATRTAPKQISRALVVDDLSPKLDRDAGSNAILSHILSLQRLGYEVTFVPALEMRDASMNASMLDTIGVHTCRAPFYMTVEEVFAGQSGEFDVVYLHRVQNAAKYGELARNYCPKARLIYSVSDLHHIRLERQALAEDRPELKALSQRIKHSELLAAAGADVVVTHSTFEAAELAKYIPAKKIYVIPWSVQLRPTETKFAQRFDIAFIGGYGHLPNLDAARWLISEIMPLVRRRDPSIKCLLVGSNMPDSLRQLCVDGIEAVGHVEDLASILSRVRLTVAPLAFGAGIKGKVLESLAAGIPCVCTPIAAEGLALPASLQGLVAEHADKIAISIHHLHSDEEANSICRQAALDFIARSFSAGNVDSMMKDAIGPQMHPVMASNSGTKFYWQSAEKPN